MYQINITSDMLQILVEKTKIYSQEYSAIIQKMIDEQIFCFSYQCTEVNCILLGKHLNAPFPEKKFAAALHKATAEVKDKLFDAQKQIDELVKND